MKDSSAGLGLKSIQVSSSPESDFMFGIDFSLNQWWYLRYRWQLLSVCWGRFCTQVLFCVHSVFKGWHHKNLETCSWGARCSWGIWVSGRPRGLWAGAEKQKHHPPLLVLDPISYLSHRLVILWFIIRIIHLVFFLFLAQSP